MSLQEQLEALAPYRSSNRLRLAMELESELQKHQAKIGRWRDRTAQIIREEVGAAESDKFLRVGVWGQGGRRTGTPLELFLRYIDVAANFLEALVDDLEQHGKPKGGRQVNHAGKRVFLVHGHDKGAKHEVARYLDGLTGFDLTILDEQPHRGQTLRQKLEAHADADFAVVLLTPDDMGNAKGKDPLPRARQNVILELGYFCGRIGFENVCVLLSDQTIEWPSDFGGSAWHPLDEHGGWKEKLRGELVAANIISN